MAAAGLFGAFVDVHGLAWPRGGLVHAGVLTLWAGSTALLVSVGIGFKAFQRRGQRICAVLGGVVGNVLEVDGEWCVERIDLRSAGVTVTGELIVLPIPRWGRRSPPHARRKCHPRGRRLRVWQRCQLVITFARGDGGTT